MLGWTGRPVHFASDTGETDFDKSNGQVYGILFTKRITEVVLMEKGNKGQYIKIRRVEMDLSQAALGHKIGKSAQVIDQSGLAGAAVLGDGY